MKINGILRKMRTDMHGETSHYFLRVGDEEVNINSYIGKEISLEFTHEIFCVKCGRKTNKSFAQGFCYPCFQTAPETEDCVLRPELCRAHVGIARDMDYAEKHCLIPHYVYLADTGALKVGVTRSTQIPTRWIDQGAERAVIIAETPNRYTAGLVEVELKKHMSDKTNWRKMLTEHEVSDKLIVEKANSIPELLSESLQNYLLSSWNVQKISFPGKACTEKIASYNFDKQDVVCGILQGVKGQYLIFEGNMVINIRKFGGYHIIFEA
ncbi:MAG: DUF2797 domain-containing protein [Bacteroidales bacterium]|jgi:hypothetical protein|nr:DUF2797 domain-containing protein [Bacteroidales bacterium]